VAAQNLDQGPKTILVQSALPGPALVVVFNIQNALQIWVEPGNIPHGSRYELAQAAICAMIAKWPSSCNSWGCKIRR
jgi:hypothetical protein